MRRLRRVNTEKCAVKMRKFLEKFGDCTVAAGGLHRAGVFPKLGTLTAGQTLNTLHFIPRTPRALVRRCTCTPAARRAAFII